MSRLTGADALGLYGAYQAVYTPQELTEEQVWEGVEEWVNALLEEGYDLSDYTWEEMYESYLEEQGGQRGSGSSASQTNQSVRIPGGRTATRVVSDLGSSLAASTKVPTSSGPRNVRGGGQTKPTPAPAASAPAKPAAPVATPAAAKPATPAAARPAASTPARPATSPAAPRPAAGAPARPAATAAPKPAAATTPAAKPAPATTPAAKPSAMDQFAKANPKLAAASAERDRTRGTSATTNPLMKDMKSRLPAPKTPSPTTAKTGFDLAKKGVNLAAGFDMFDVVKGYLIGEGYADTEEAALAIMINMSEEWRQSIVEEAGKNDARIRGNIKSFGSNYTPPRDWDQSANRGQGAVLNAKQKEKQRRKGLRQEEYKESFNIFVNSMIAEGVSMERYTWEEIQNVFDDLFEAQVANRDPDEYERKAKQGQSREQQLKGKVMGRMDQMDPEKRKKMLAQMRAVGLDV